MRRYWFIQQYHAKVAHCEYFTLQKTQQRRGFKVGTPNALIPCMNATTNNGVIKMANENKKYVFIGQNASTGTPNSTTGRMSTYGKIYCVDGGLKTAREFENHMYYKETNHCLTKSGSASAMRQFCLGQSVRDFNETLSECPIVCYNNEDDSWECDGYKL